MGVGVGAFCSTEIGSSDLFQENLKTCHHAFFPRYKELDCKELLRIKPNGTSELTPGPFPLLLFCGAVASSRSQRALRSGGFYLNQNVSHEFITTRLSGHSLCWSPSILLFTADPECNSRSEHITPIPAVLHQLPPKYRVQFQVAKTVLDWF